MRGRWKGPQANMKNGSIVGRGIQKSQDGSWWVSPEWSRNNNTGVLRFAQDDGEGRSSGGEKVLYRAGL